MNDFDFITINPTLQTFKAFKKQKSDLIRNKTKSKIRAAIGINQESSGRKFELKLKSIEEEYWHIAWSRFYHAYSLDIELTDWIADIGKELFLIKCISKDPQCGFRFLRTFFNHYLLDYLNSISYEVYGNKNLARQKSEEALEKTIYQIVTHLHQYSPYKSGFRSWSFTIAKNILLTPNEKTYEFTELILDNESESELEAIILDQETFWNKTPEQNYAEKYIGKCIFEIFCTECGYPWQVLCSGLLELGYKPKSIVEQYSNSTLGELFKDFSDHLFGKSNQNKEEWIQVLANLNEKLQLRLEELLSDYDSRTKRNLNHYLTQKCSTIPLKEFFGIQPNKNISDWNIRVRKKLKQQLKRESIIE
ncbi:MAG TPA: hypothetical protein P5107_03600 [Thermotogota bacterium]|nr:hypothetical protein [Thermotogota bacterium]